MSKKTSAIKKLKKAVRDGGTTPTRPSKRKLAELQMSAREWDTAVRQERDRVAKYRGSDLDREHQNNVRGFFGRRSG